MIARNALVMISRSRSLMRSFERPATDVLGRIPTVPLIGG